MGSGCLLKDDGARISVVLDTGIPTLRMRDMLSIRFLFLWIDAANLPCRKNGNDATVAMVAITSFGEDGVGCVIDRAESSVLCSTRAVSEVQNVLPDCVGIHLHRFRTLGRR